MIWCYRFAASREYKYSIAKPTLQKKSHGDGGGSSLNVAVVVVICHVRPKGRLRPNASPPSAFFFIQRGMVQSGMVGSTTINKPFSSRGDVWVAECQFSVAWFNVGAPRFRVRDKTAAEREKTSTFPISLWFELLLKLYWWSHRCWAMHCNGNNSREFVTWSVNWFWCASLPCTSPTALAEECISRHHHYHFSAFFLDEALRLLLCNRRCGAANSLLYLRSSNAIVLKGKNANFLKDFGML